jgi:Flp pilus assembly pilin Flp
MSKAEMLLKKTRGATMVEYALLIIAIMFLAAIGYRNLGKSVAKNAKDSQGELDKHDQAQ